MMIPILFLSLLFLLTVPSSSQELFFPGFKHQNSNITLNGVAEIEENGILRLTNETSRLIGHAFYTSPFRFKNSTSGAAFSFSATFALAIVPEYPKLGGHGLAFTIATSTDLKGALPRQYLGLLNSSKIGNFSNHLFAVEFDTVQDFVFQDMNDNHVGIDLNSLVSNASASAGYFGENSSVKQNLTLKSGIPILAWIDYDSGQNLIDVTISPNSSKPNLPILSFPVDLSPIFEEFMYVGFSASTGLLASSHYILGWSFKIGGEAQNLDLSSLPSLPGPRNTHTALKIGVSASSVILALSAAAIAVFFVIKKIKNREVIEDWELEIGPQRYKYQELKKATNNFSEKMVLGHGGFGKVFKGILPDSKLEIAVKRISHESKQGLREFVSEIASIGRLRHRNLVQFLGWCRRGGELHIVYDFMPNESLDKFLFDEPKRVLNWEERFKIIKGVASGLLYLHEGYEQVVIHRDVKASNVLLDDELNGKLGDFGLARLYEHGSNPGTSRVVGTLGYLAPEVPRTGKATTSSDVYAFGALLLEVSTGRRPIEPKAEPEELVLADWVWGRFREGKLLDVVDPKLEGKYDEVQVVTVLKLGLLCSGVVPVARPNMRQVVRFLDGEMVLPENLSKPGGYDRETAVGFEEFLHSASPKSSCDGMSSSSFVENGNGGASSISLSTSPLYLLRETRRGL